jgi:inorganic pyrophosphatase
VSENAERNWLPHMKPDLTSWLGRKVSVQIDRPINSAHPERPDLIYQLNYGFVPGTLSGDGEAIDAYVLGVETPLNAFSGVVIAVIIRANDCEDKLVVAPLGMEVSDAEITSAVAFQEKYFETILRRARGGPAR